MLPPGSIARDSSDRWPAEAIGLILEPNRTCQPDLDTDPTWSPYGKVILFASDRRNDDGSTDLWVMRPDGTGASRLWGERGEEQEPAWHRWSAGVEDPL